MPLILLPRKFKVIALLIGFLAGWQVPVKSAQPTQGIIAFHSGRTGNMEIFVAAAGGSGAVNISNHPGYDVYPDVSPDGRRIAFVSARDGNEEIYVMNSDGTEQTRLTTNPGVDGAPHWSPDGSKIAFYSARGNLSTSRADIYVMNADGGAQTQLTTDPDVDVFPAWSPDGSKIAFVAHRDGNAEIYVMDANLTPGADRHETNLSRYPGFDHTPAWKPNSKIAFASERDNNVDIYLMNADGSGVSRLTSNALTDSNPAISPDGSQIAFARSTSSEPLTSDVFIISGAIETPVTSGGNSGAPSWGPTPAALVPPAMSIGHVTVTEGNGGTVNAVFTLSLSAPCYQNVTVAYATGNGLAAASSDYRAASGSVSFLPGEMSKTVTVAVNGDTTAEPNETFFVFLSNCVNAVIGDGQGVGSIINDDGGSTPDTTPPTASVSLPTAGAVTSLLSQIRGYAQDNAGGIGLNRVDLQIVRRRDGASWNGSRWVSAASHLSTTLTGTSWYRAAYLPGRLEDGLYTIGAYAYDHAGNRSLTAIDIISDTAAPILFTIDAPLADTITNVLDLVRGQVRDNVGGSGIARVDLQIVRQRDRSYWNGSGWIGSVSNLSTIIQGTGWQRTSDLPGTLEDGRYTIQAYAYDMAGNVRFVSSSIIADKVAPPVLYFEIPVNGAFSDLSLVRGQVQDNSGGSGIARVDLQVVRQHDGARWDGSQWASAVTNLSTVVRGTTWSRTSGLPTSNDLSNGRYILIATAYDRAGNRMIATISGDIAVSSGG